MFFFTILKSFSTANLADLSDKWMMCSERTIISITMFWQVFPAPLDL